MARRDIEQEFLTANVADWGDGPMSDCMAGLDALVADGLADPDRMGVTGGSYGGYLTSWIVGHTDRFKAAVTCRSVDDMVSQMLSGDIGGPTFGLYEYGVHPWEDWDLYRRHSPLTYATSVTTPLLIQHSENDLRCTITQAEELFAVLRSHRRTVRLMRMPDESHELTRSGTPFRRVDNARLIDEWFRHFLVEGKTRLPRVDRSGDSLPILARMPSDLETAIATGYGFEGPAITFGAAMQDEEALPGAQVRVPLAMMNRHGLVAGATGTGKTKTLQVLAEQLSDAGVPVFISDIKGDISGLAAPAVLNEKLTARAQAIGMDGYAPKAFPVEFLTLDRDGKGVRLRASVSSSDRSCWRRCWTSTRPSSPCWR